MAAQVFSCTACSLCLSGWRRRTAVMFPGFTSCAWRTTRAAIHPQFGQNNPQHLWYGWDVFLSQPHFVIHCRPTRQVCSRAFAVLIPASRSELHWLFSQRGVQSSADTLLALPVQLLAVPPEGAQTAATTTHAVCSPC